MSNDTIYVVEFNEIYSAELIKETPKGFRVKREIYPGRFFERLHYKTTAFVELKDAINLVEINLERDVRRGNNILNNAHDKKALLDVWRNAGS